MDNLQKMGGIATLINAGAYIIGFAMAFTLLLPVLEGTPEEYIAFLVDNQTLMFIWHTIIYLVAGVFMVPMVLALHDRLQAGASALMQIATAFGLIWAGLVLASGMLLVNDAGIVADVYQTDPAQAKTVWLALSAVENGLGGAIELPGGIWVLLISLVGLRLGILSKGLHILGLIVGAAGILTVVPILYEAGTVFGLGCIIWFIWVGVSLIRQAPNLTQETTSAFVPSHTTS